MKAILCYFCYKSNQSSVHYRCLAFSLAFLWYEIFEMHVAARGNVLISFFQFFIKKPTTMKNDIGVISKNVMFSEKRLMCK